jgi:CRP-like cAMP-binding protein
MTVIWHPEKLDWLRKLPTEARNQLRGASSWRDYEPNQAIFAPEPNPQSLYLLEQGLVRIYRLSGEGAETTFGYVAPGEVFGELAAFGDYPRESFAQAVLNSRVWRIPRDVFLRLVGSRPELMAEVTRQIGNRLKRIESRVEHLVFSDVRSRVVQILLELAEDFGEPEQDGVRIGIALTQAELATLIGSTRQTVNSTLRDLEQEGLLGRTSGRILVRDKEKLRKAVSAPQS